MSTFTKVLKYSTGFSSLGIIAYYTFDRYSKPVNAATHVYTNPILSTYQNERTKWDSNWDCRHDLEERYKEKKKVPKRHLILIRHGQYNTKGVTDSQMKLTPLGREQARMTGERLKQLNLPYTKLVHSTMTRAVETAEIIQEYLPNVPVVECSMLEEGAPIEPEPPSRRWRAPYFFHQDGARIEAAFRKYFHRAHPEQEKESYEVIVCHANVIRYFVCRALQIPPEAWLRLSLRHASLTTITISNGGKVSLRSFSDAGYMPPEALTTS